MLEIYMPESRLLISQTASVKTEDGILLSIWLPKSREVIAYKNEYCRFVPSGWIDIDGRWKPLLFKVVTTQMKSLGLRRNPNILTYPLDQWFHLPDAQVCPGVGDWGGIWSVLRFSSAKALSKYMVTYYGLPTKIFLAAGDNPLYANNYRVKIRGIRLIKELTEANIWKKALLI